MWFAMISRMAVGTLEALFGSLCSYAEKVGVAEV